MSARRHRAALAALAAAGATTLLTSCSSGPEAQLAPDAAATQVARNLELSQEQMACVKQRFDDDRSAAAILNSGIASKEARERFVPVIRACLPMDVFAPLMQSKVSDVFTDGNEQQADCIRSTMIGLPANEQDLLYVYFANAGAVELVELQGVTKKFIDGCHLDTASTPGTPGAPRPSGTAAGPNAGPAGTVPDATPPGSAG